MKNRENVMDFLERERKFIDSVIGEYLPKKFDKKYLEWLVGKPSYEHTDRILTKSIAEPVWDFLGRGGKRWRPALFLLLAEALGGERERIKDFLVILELLHNGSIIVDDIEDSSDYRRGKPSLHKIFGTDIAINAGNFLYFLPLIAISKNSGNFDDKTINRAWDACIQEMIKIHLGQAADIGWHNGLQDPEKIKEGEYLQMCAYKTGVLARLAGRLAVILTGGDKVLEEKLGKLGESIGILFQIQDDILNLKPSEKWGKEIGDDINEGKKTLLVIHTLKEAEDKDRKRLVEILNMHTKDRETIKEAIGIIDKYGSFEYAKEFARNMVKDVWKEVDPLIKGSDVKEQLKDFVEFLAERDI